MKSIQIEVNNSNISCATNPNSNGNLPWLWHVTIPILPAFSVEYFTIHEEGVTNISTPHDDISGDKLIIAADYVPSTSSIFIILHYHGIRDYSLLFPWVSNPDLKTRLGQFYQEAEKNFESGAWLSFALMCAAVFEGMLFAKLTPNSTRNTFNFMIQDAFQQNLLNAEQRDIMEKARNLRNLVHGGKYNLPYITRTDAMDIRTTMDKLIKYF